MTSLDDEYWLTRKCANERVVLNNHLKQAFLERVAIKVEMGGRSEDEARNEAFDLVFKVKK